MRCAVIGVVMLASGCGGVTPRWAGTASLGPEDTYRPPAEEVASYRACMVVRLALLAGKDSPRATAYRPWEIVERTGAAEIACDAMPTASTPPPEIAPELEARYPGGVYVPGRIVEDVEVDEHERDPRPFRRMILEVFVRDVERANPCGQPRPRVTCERRGSRVTALVDEITFYRARLALHRDGDPQKCRAVTDRLDRRRRELDELDAQLRYRDEYRGWTYRLASGELLDEADMQARVRAALSRTDDPLCANGAARNRPGAATSPSVRSSEGLCEVRTRSSGCGTTGQRVPCGMGCA